MEMIVNKANRISKKIEKPIFVVGCCNSGTTILWRALKKHNELDGPETEGQDLQELPLCMRHFLGKKTFRMFAHPTFKYSYHLKENDFEKSVAQRLADLYAEHLEPGKRLIEKSPANLLRTRFLQSVFPDATFVIIVRNGIAVSEGIVRKRWYDPERPHMAGLKTTIEEASLQWHHANRIILQDKIYLKRYIMVKYEDLVKDTNKVLHSILNFCECSISDFPIPGFEKNLNAKQIARLSLTEKNAIHKIANKTLRYFGYNCLASINTNQIYKFTEKEFDK